MKRLFTAIFLVVCSSANAQRYNDSIVQFRHHYKQEFLTDSHSPLKAADTGYLRFFEPDMDYRVKGTFVATPEAKPFSMPTHSGKDKKYRQYGIVTFRIHDTVSVLHIYQSIDLLKNPKYKDYLFIPFTDATTYSETYGGGRYLDLSINDIKGNEIVLDFNKCYNPYCAYAGGYSCPIPPRENELKVAIMAGEMLYGKNIDGE